MTSVVASFMSKTHSTPPARIASLRYHYPVASTVPALFLTAWFGAAQAAPSACSGHLPACIVAAARSQIGVTTRYDSSYARISYPGGDVPLDRGVCTDVVIRAYPKAGLDLQVLVHEDMQRARPSYPGLWSRNRTDANIDHRRVPNLAVFFSRHGKSIRVTRDRDAYQAGDVVIWRLPSGVPHIGIVSDRRSSSGVPLVIHNIGAGAAEEDSLFAFTITGHYRYFPNVTGARNPGQ